MCDLNFPLVSTKTKDSTAHYDLASPEGRNVYFEAKVGPELKTIREYLSQKPLMIYMVGKKNSGKGTYSKLFSEALGMDNTVHLSVGDLVRETHANWEQFKSSEKYIQLKAFYRGHISLEEAEERLLSRSASALLPTEFILALVRLKIEEYKGRTLFLDGFPREEDQISYTLFLKDLVNRSENKDMFVLISIPDEVIDERIKYRVICPKCQTPRNLKLLTTSKVGFDEEKQEFYLMCDNPGCDSSIMIRKEGDDLGIAPIKDRLAKDQLILEKVYNLSGISKILLRNSVPVEQASQYFDDYELTPAYSYQRDEKTGVITTKEDPWVVKDNNGVGSYSLMPAPVAVSLIKQIAKLIES